MAEAAAAVPRYTRLRRMPSLHLGDTRASRPACSSLVSASGFNESSTTCTALHIRESKEVIVRVWR
jgi:hypothetical protein